MNSSLGSHPTTVVLASKSPARLTTLCNAGIEPIVRVSEVNEDALVTSFPSGPPEPVDLVCALAEAKALDVAESLQKELTRTPPEEVLPSQYLVIGCDSMLEIGGKLVGKPGTPEVAKERIREMRGRDATLWTGHSLIPLTQMVEPSGTPLWILGNPLTKPAATVVHFGQISDEEIDAYVQTGEPLDVAGSFTIDGLGGPFIEGVTGDPQAVVGLSLPLMRKLVSQLNVGWPSLWTGE